MTVKSKPILIGGLYRPPHSSTDYFNKINEIFDRIFNTNVADILITGAFKMKEHSSLTQLILEATLFTVQSPLLSDLILVRNTTSIVTSRVADSFIPDQCRFHCTILLLLNVLRPSVKSREQLSTFSS